MRLESIILLENSVKAKIRLHSDVGLFDRYEKKVEFFNIYITFHSIRRGESTTMSLLSTEFVKIFDLNYQAPSNTKMRDVLIKLKLKTKSQMRDKKFSTNEGINTLNLT